MLTLHDMLLSGNCHKVRLLLRWLGIPFRRVEVDVFGGGSHTPEFLALNPAGKVPVLVWDDGRTLPESGAILLHFAEGTDWLPADAWARAQVYRWMFWEQYSHETSVAVIRSVVLYDRPFGADRKAQLLKDGTAALALMDRHLQGREWLVGNRRSLADLALYPYTAVAEDGGLDLAGFPHLRAWLDRFAGLPGFVPMDHDAGWEGTA
ncbi:MAG: glutathione S-transferase family protein [Rhodospirillaceae bacterium]|nr:glutathione S-transferase family protein [Rhodospirillaceae bacterium]